MKNPGSGGLADHETDVNSVLVCIINTGY